MNIDSLDLSALVTAIPRRQTPLAQRRALIALIAFSSMGVINIVLFALTPRDADYRPLVAGSLLVLIAAAVGALLLVVGFWLRDTLERTDAARLRVRAELAQLPSYSAPSPRWTRGDVLWIVLAGVALLTGAVVWFLPLALLLGVFMLLILLRQFFDRWVYGALEKANYDQALRGLDTAVNWLPRPLNFASRRGLVLIYAGRIDQAITVFEAQAGQAIHSNNPYVVPLALNNLAYALLLARRHADALPLLESAIRLDPRNSATYGSLAAYYLDQQAEAMRALEIAEFALEHTPRLDDFTHHVLIALCGIARARIHQSAQDSLLAVLRFADHHRCKPEQAILYVMAAQMIHDPRAAREHLLRARALDPHGYAGRAALALLVGPEVG